MRKIRYSVATSLDGYIAGVNGEDDWILMDPDIDFGAMLDEFDTVLMGRRSYERLQQRGGVGMFGKTTYVFSKTLRQADHPEATIVADDIVKVVADLRSGAGKDSWLFGGGSLFAALLNLGLVDTVEVAVIPVLLGDGVPLFPGSAKPVSLALTAQSVLKKTGTLRLEYAVRDR